MTMKKKIVLIDDHPLIRKGIALTLEEEPLFEVLTQFSSAEEALANIQDHPADVAIVDVSLPGMNGIELVKHLRGQNGQIKILVVSRHDEELYAERALRAGANGYLMKQEAGDVLIKAVKRILDGGLYVSDSVSARMLQSMMQKKPAAEQSPLELMSDRELEVFEHIGRGLANKEIADRLHVSVKTIETYKARIKEKTGLESSHDITRLAIEWIQGM